MLYHFDHTDYFDSPGKIDIDVCIAQKYVFMANNGSHVHSSKFCMHIYITHS